MYLIWSNQRAMWWRGDQSGYTQFIEEAGRYSGYESGEIIQRATCDGLLKHQRIDPVTGRPYVSFDEVRVLAPEALP